MNTTSIMDLCFLCTKDYNCVAVNNKKVFQVEYVLPEITIFKLGLPLRICSDCDGALCAFSKFKQSSVETSRRLEARIKGAQGPLLHTDSPPVVDDNETSDVKPEKIEKICTKEEPMEQTSLDAQLHTDGPSENIQPHTHRALPNSTIQLQRVSAEPQNQLHNHLVCQNIQLDTDTNSDNAEHIFIKEEPLEETPQDKEFYNNIIIDVLKEEFLNNSVNDETVKYNTQDTSATLNTSDDVWQGSSADSTEFTVEETENIQINEKKEYRCSICNSRFLKQSSLTYHMKKVHWRKKDLPCIICKKLFIHKYDLNRHMKVHNKIKNFHCPVCKIKFLDQRNYVKQHLNLHVDQKDFHCETCNETFTLEIYLKNHITHRESQVEESLKCNKFNKTFALKRNLDDHMKIHAKVKDFHCDICNKSFAQKHYFLKHMKIHSEVFDYHCDICNKSFVHKNHLGLHMKIHSEVKDFRCDICSKMFRYKSNLVDHMKIHFGVKEFHCDICSKSFTQKSNLVAHMKKMHF